jgi:predicted enzyme related to lactoylglutathione lyase
VSTDEHAKPETATTQGVAPGQSRPGGLSYLHIPAADVQQSATFYERVFGWTVHRRDASRAGFVDGTGHVAGAWVTDQAISREPGLLPYIYVDRIDDTLRLVTTEGGEVVRAPYPEGNLWVATIRDPAGNVIGVWQAAPR